jgi:hypothetical protein
MAGGSPWAIGAPGWGVNGAAAAGVRYKNTSHARQGDLGSKVCSHLSATVLARSSVQSSPPTHRLLSVYRICLSVHVRLCAASIMQVLPETPTGTVWTAGSLVEVSWTMRTK